MDNNKRQYILIQRIYLLLKDHKKAPIVPDSVVSCDITEHANMAGTILLMTLNDSAGQFRDNLKLKYGSVIEVSYGDVLNDNGNMIIDNFVVLSAISAGKNLMLECIQQTCYELKQPAKLPRFFVDKPPSAILKALLNGVKLHIDCDNLSGTYHLNAGANASRLIRTMARDHGCLAYYLRNVFYFVDIKKAMATNSGITLESGNNKAKYPIQHYVINDKLYMFERILDKKFLQIGRAHV